jgi:hypothetical protein
MSNRHLPPTYRLFRVIWIVLFVLVVSAAVGGIALLVSSSIASVRLG